MTEQTEFMGFPLITATPQELRTAVMLGRFLHRTDDTAFYEYDGKLFVIPANVPPNNGEAAK